MKVIHVLAPVSFGGGEKLLLTLLKERREDLEEEIVLLFSAPRFERELEKNGIPYYVILKKSLGHGIGKKETMLRTLESLINAGKLRKILLKNAYDIIHMHGFTALIVTLFVAPADIKKVYTHHAERSKPKNIEKIVFTHLYNKIDEKIGVSDTVTDSLNNAFPKMKKKFVTICNCISDDFYAPIDKKYNNSEQIKMIQVGRFTDIKNQQATVEAIAHLPEKWKKKIEVWFVGDGELRAYVEEQSRVKGVAEKVKFWGAKEPTEIIKLIDQCEFGIMSSKKEGFGLAAVEYMARGIPVIAIENNAMLEVVGETGYIEPEEEFVSAFIEAFEDNEKDLKGAKAREKALEYTPRKTKDKYVKICYTKRER